MNLLTFLILVGILSIFLDTNNSEIDNDLDDDFDSRFN